MKIGLIGDYQESVTAHRAIPEALRLAALENSSTMEYSWLHSTQLKSTTLEDFSGLWCVPASPYVDDDSVIEVIKYAREANVPFLGTCGGYQYAALEFARSKLGYSDAESAEVVPDANMPLISSLACSLRDESAGIELSEGTKIRKIYGESNIIEEYYCGYGINPQYLPLFEDTDMLFSGFDDSGDPRSLEITTNRFFIGTAFQPERSALNGVSHPLICAYLAAASGA